MINNVYTDMLEMFQSGNIDAVYIASPNAFHAEQSILAMKNGIHVLCEKPAVTNLSEMDQVIKASEQYQNNLYGSYEINRYARISQFEKELG